MTFPTPDEGFARNLRESLQSYKNHGVAFTRVLIRPILLQLVGVYGCLILTYLVLEGLLALFGTNPLLIGLVTLPLAFGTILIFCRGFWEYMIYMVSLCRNAEEAWQGQSPDFAAACAATSRKKASYAAYLLMLVGLQMIPVFCFWLVTVLALGFGRVLGQVASLFIMVSGGLLAGIVLVAVILAMVYVSLGFQVLAFEKVQSDPSYIPKRSIALVKGRFWRVAGLQALWLFLTTALIPGLIILLFQVTGLAGPLNMFHHWLLALILDQAQPLGGGLDPIPNYEAIYSLLNAQRPLLADVLSSTLISTVAPMLLLPLGSFSFTRVYLSSQGER